MHRAEIVSIGNEVLRGSTTNTNASFLSQLLTQLGFRVEHHQVVSDEGDQIQQSLELALERSDLVLTTGGLGPTLDDLTRRAICETMGSSLVFRKEVEQDLVERFGSELSSIRDQSMQPESAELILNQIGTAPGLLLHRGKKFLAVLPGVPLEMRAMAEGALKDRLAELFPQRETKFWRELHFALLKESDIDVVLRRAVSHHPAVEFGIYPGIGSVSVHMSGGNQAAIDAAANELAEAFPDHLFSREGSEIEAVLKEHFVANRQSLALAESCTGGAMAAALTSVAGASEYFQGSVVSYSNQMKQSVLGVSERTLQNHGAVSEQTVREMALGVQKLTEADYSVAITGVAGPQGGSDRKPVGTVWIGIAKPGGEVVTIQMQRGGNRETIIHRSVRFAMGYLWMEITH